MNQDGGCKWGHGNWMSRQSWMDMRMSLMDVMYRCGFFCVSLLLVDGSLHSDSKCLMTIELEWPLLCREQAASVLSVLLVSLPN
jgi:hypothetical protein